MNDLNQALKQWAFLMERHDEKEAFHIFRGQFPSLTMQEVREVRQAHKNKQTEMSSLRDRIALAAVRRELAETVEQHVRDLAMEAVRQGHDMTDVDYLVKRIAQNRFKDCDEYRALLKMAGHSY